MASAGIGDRVEGIHAVAAALEAGRLRTLHVERSRLAHDEIAAIVGAAHDRSVDVVVVDDVRSLAATGAPQGVVAEATPIPFLDLDEIPGLTDPAAALVLDHLEDPRNVGAIARSAHAAGIPALVVSGRRSAPIGATAFKAAAGALEHVRVVRVASIPEALRRLSQRGMWIVGLDADRDGTLWDLDLLDQPAALVVGAEGGGLHRLTAERCDVVVAIPMAPGVESINVSVAASLAMFEMARRRYR